MARDLAAKAANLIRRADSVLVTCGAGLGVNSGLPDFRGPQGFWRAFPVAEKLGLRFEELANPVWFRDDPELAWGFYGYRYNTYRAAVPHEGYHILLDLITRDKRGNGFVYTTNVDGLWTKAGLPPDRLYEVHGCIHYIQCCQPRTCYHATLKQKIFPLVRNDDFPVDMSTLRVPTEAMPVCPRGCGSVARPSILLFGDGSWISDRSDEQERRLESWLGEVESGHQRLVVIDVGSGSTLPTARMMAESTARGLKHAGASIIRINPTEPEVASTGVMPAGTVVEMRETALVGLQAIRDALRAGGSGTSVASDG